MQWFQGVHGENILSMLRRDIYKNIWHCYGKWKTLETYIVLEKMCINPTIPGNDSDYDPESRMNVVAIPY